MDIVKRYTLRSFASYENEKDLVQNYKKYLWNTGLMQAYDDFDDETMNKKIKSTLYQNQAKGSLAIKDRVVEAWAKENDIKMVNTL